MEVQCRSPLGLRSLLLSTSAVSVPRPHPLPPYEDSLVQSSAAGARRLRVFPLLMHAPSQYVFAPNLLFDQTLQLLQNSWRNCTGALLTRFFLKVPR